MLSISDWISFLISEKNPNIGIIVSFSAFILAAFAIVMAVTNNTLAGGISAALVCFVLAIMYFRTIGPYGHRAKEAGKLLKDIMSGKERDPLKIEERWNSVLIKVQRDK
jgi:hypothetical protein